MPQVQKTRVLLELDDSFIREVDKIRGEAPLPHMLELMLTWAFECMEVLARNPTIMKMGHKVE